MKLLLTAMLLLLMQIMYAQKDKQKSINPSKKTTGSAPIIIQEQGSFAVGGTVIANPGTFDPIKDGAFNPSSQNSAGQTLHGDHAYVFYQIPSKPHKLPLVFWHGHGQSIKTWQTTPDGREGYQNIFLRRQFPVYLIDQPRRGEVILPVLHGCNN
jgi:hypothetical protein